MSEIQPKWSMVEPSQETFTAIAVTSSRAHVLSALVQQAAEHFGDGPLFITDLSVVACYSHQDTGTTSFLTTATITRHE